MTIRHSTLRFVRHSFNRPQFKARAGTRKKGKGKRPRFADAEAFRWFAKTPLPCFADNETPKTIESTTLTIDGVTKTHEPTHNWRPRDPGPPQIHNRPQKPFPLNPKTYFLPA